MSKVAAIQMASGPNVDANLHEAGRLISQAAAAGAELIVLPENFAIMGIEESDKIAVREAQGNGPIQTFLSDQAKQHNAWIVGVQFHWNVMIQIKFLQLVWCMTTREILLNATTRSICLM